MCEHEHRCQRPPCPRRRSRRAGTPVVRHAGALPIARSAGRWVGNGGFVRARGRAPAFRPARRTRRHGAGICDPDAGPLRRRLPVGAVPERPVRDRAGARPRHRPRPAGGDGAYRRRAGLLPHRLDHRRDQYGRAAALRPAWRPAPRQDLLSTVGRQPQEICGGMSDLILHHYDFSNFAEKARLMLGFKRLAWRSVEQPPILPKPNLVPLTGGYRPIPWLQDGADLWCDTRLIARELERRAPSPTLFPERTRGFADTIAWWAEHQFMRPVALFVSGINADHMPAGLNKNTRPRPG